MKRKIIKIDHIYDGPAVAYITAEKAVWADTECEKQVLSKEGDFTIQGGQHSITSVDDPSLADGQYNLYMFNNNIGCSAARPDFDWSALGLTDSFKLPYSGHVSSVQNLDGNTIADSGTAGTFWEYDEDHHLIAQFEMQVEKYIYRVYKDDFDGFYFRAGK